MTDRAHEYREYIKSKAWRTLREQARERSGHKCELCGAPAEHVHHVRYPKRFADDHIDNLVVVCGSCHSRLHGMRGDKQIMEIVPFEAGQVLVQVRSVDFGGERWIHVDDVITMYTAGIPPSLDHGIKISKRNLESELKEDEFKWFDVDENGRLRTLRFLNDLGVGRAGMMFPGERATKVRDWYQDLHREQRARLGRSAEMNADMVENIGQALTWIAGQMRQKADLSQVTAVEQRVHALEQVQGKLLSAASTAGLVAATSRQYLLMNNLHDDPLPFGMACRKQCELNGIDPDAVSTIMEGTQRARVWPIEILEATARARNLRRQ